MTLNKLHYQEQQEQLIKMLVQYYDNSHYEEDLNEAGAQALDDIKTVEPGIVGFQKPALQRSQKQLKLPNPFYCGM